MEAPLTLLNLASNSDPATYEFRQQIEELNESARQVGGTLSKLERATFALCVLYARHHLPTRVLFMDKKCAF